MKKIHFVNFWNKSRKYLTNKYLITVFVFAVVFAFCGNQSFVKRVKNAKEISVKEEKLREYDRLIQSTRQELQALDNPDSLEQFARVHYLMHADKEDVYLIEE